MIAPALVFTQLVLNLPVGRSQLIDVNDDGYLDLVVEGRVYLQKDGSFQPDRVYENASFMMWGDLDNDGHLDSVTIRRKGTSTVNLGSSQKDLDPPNQNTVGAALADLDKDGVLDLALANSYVEEGKSLEAEPLRIYQHDYQPQEITQSGPPGAANAHRPLFGITATDLDNDGFPELLGAAYGRQWNVLYQRHQDRYLDCAAKYGLDGDAIRHGSYPDKTKRPLDELPFRANGNTFCLAPADFDGDGDWDIFSSEITHSWAGDSSDLSALLINRLEKFKEPYFDRQIEIQDDPETGFKARPKLGLHRDHSPQKEKWNQGDLQAHWADLNNDGNLDLIVCESDYPHNHLRIWLQNDQHQFSENTDLKFNNCPGAAVGDIDRDGDLDLVTTGTLTRWPEARKTPELALWTNQTQEPSLNLKLIGNGQTTNRNAMGARIFLTTTSGQQSREIQGTYGHWGQQTQPGEAHFGLGQATPISLKIIWPDLNNSQTTLTQLPKKGWLVIDQEQNLIYQDEKFNPHHWSGEPPAPSILPRKSSSPAASKCASSPS